MHWITDPGSPDDLHVRSTGRSWSWAMLGPAHPLSSNRDTTSQRVLGLATVSTSTVGLGVGTRSFSPGARRSGARRSGRGHPLETMLFVVRDAVVLRAITLAVHEAATCLRASSDLTGLRVVHHHRLLGGAARHHDREDHTREPQPRHDQACSVDLPGRRSSPTAMATFSRFHRMPLMNAV